MKSNFRQGSSIDENNQIKKMKELFESICERTYFNYTLTSTDH